MHGMDLSRVVLFAPWSHVRDGAGLEAELAREVCESHRLFPYLASLRAVARRSNQDEYLYATADFVAVVHLTWSKESDPLWPSTTVYSGLDDWMKNGMLPDHHDYVCDGSKHDSFALELTCPLTLDAIEARVREELGVRFIVGASTPAAEGTTRLRIEADEKSHRFTLYASIVQNDVPYRQALSDDRWYVSTLPILTSFVERLGATAIDACSFDDE